MKNYLFFLNILLFTANQSNGQMHLRIAQIPDYYTPIMDTIYFAGSQNNWDPGSPQYFFDVDQRIELPQFDGELSYKVTRGTWASVEANAIGGDIGNRKLTYAEGAEEVIDVPEWRDMYRSSHSATSGVFVLKTLFVMPQLDRVRRIWIYLPQDYFLTVRDYPVLYMHDGQNIFDVSYSFAGEWKVDEAMVAMASNRGDDCIVVGIENGQAYRIDEYTPYRHPTYGGGRGEDYVAFIVQTLKPFIDDNFRTLDEPNHTGIAGSSLGGLISFYAGLTYPEVFGRVGVFSPSFWYSDSLVADVKSYEVHPEQKFYIMGASNEDEDMEPDIDQYIQLLIEQGLPKSQIARVIRSNGAHSEWFWAREFPACFQWLDLWGDRLDVPGTVAWKQPEFFGVTGSPSDKPRICSLNPVSGKKRIVIFDRRGQIVEQGSMDNYGCYSLSDSIPGGVYYALVQVGKYSQSLKLVKL